MVWLIARGYPMVLGLRWLDAGQETRRQVGAQGLSRDGRRKCDPAWPMRPSSKWADGISLTLFRSLLCGRSLGTTMRG